MAENGDGHRLGRDFRLFWLGESTSKLGSSITAVALPLVAVSTLGASSFLVGLLTAAVWIPWLVIGLPAGAWVDRWPRRPIMLTCNAASAVALASVPVAAWLGLLTIAHVIIVALVIGVTTVFFSTAYQVFLPALVAPADLPPANARLQGSESAARVAGPGLGGLLAQLLRPANALLADAASFIVSTICLLSIRTREAAREAAPGRRSLRREIGEGLRFLARDPYLRPIVVFGALSNLALIGFQAILVVFLVRDVGVGPGGVGGLIAVTSTGGIAGAALATRISRSIGTARGLLLCQLGTAPFALLIPLTSIGTGLLYFLVGYALVGAGIVASNVIIASFRQLYCPPELLGRVTATTRFVNYGTLPVGAVLGGTLGGAIGNRPMLWVLAICLMFTGLILLLSPISRRRDLPTPVASVRAAAQTEPA